MGRNAPEGQGKTKVLCTMGAASSLPPPPTHACRRLCACPRSSTCLHSTSRWWSPSRWHMLGRCGASVHRCQGPLLRHKVRGGNHHTLGSTHGHRELPACDLEPSTILLQHLAWCIACFLGCGAAAVPCLLRCSYQYLM